MYMETNFTFPPKFVYKTTKVVIELTFTFKLQSLGVKL